MSHPVAEKVMRGAFGEVSLPWVFTGCAFGDWVGATKGPQGFTPELAWRSLTLAYEAGYRNFDGAHVYATERHLGTILGAKFASGELNRKDVFLTSKVAHPSAPPHVVMSPLRTMNADKVEDVQQVIREHFARVLDDLGVGQTDLLLLHWPGLFHGKDAAFQRKTRKEMWTVMMELAKKGATRAIGVANFSKEHLEQLAEDCPEWTPSVNQIEYHPYCQDRELEAYCTAKGIVIQAYAPFASGAFGLLKDPTLASIAERVGKSVGQVILRWHVQCGRVVLPKSTSLERMKQNLDVFSFNLSPEDVAAIDSLGNAEAKRSCPAPAAIL